MDKRLIDQIGLLEKNMGLLNECFKWENSHTKRLVAVLYAFEDLGVDCAAIKRHRAALKKNAAQFSCFKGMNALIVSAILGLYNGGDFLADVLELYDMLTAVGFSPSNHLMVAAQYLAVRGERNRFEHIVLRTHQFYAAMRLDNRLVAGKNNHVLAALFALTDYHIELVMERAGYYQSELKAIVRSNGGVWALWYVLTLCGQRAPVSLERLQGLFEILENKKYRLQNEYLLSFMGILSFVEQKPEETARQLIELDDYLKQSKGIGNWGVQKNARLMLAAFMLGLYHLNGRFDQEMKTTIVNNFIGMMMAQPGSAQSAPDL